MGLGSGRLAIIGLLATVSVVAFSSEYAQARAARHDTRAARSEGRPAKAGKHHRVIHGPGYRPPFASIVVDANSGQVLQEQNPDEPRHPASLTKVMTLYLLFEQIEAGKLKLDTPLPISAEAAMQNPTKLGLKPGQTISVEDALRGLVTRSANDAAVVIAEAIGETQGEFARQMTVKARALGMSNTTYVNASGLPAIEQVTTARDQAILGRAIQDRFPGFYHYFSLPSFRYRKVEIRNHNGLLGSVKGVDGIKTGYTEASGYNLLASIRRDDRHLVAVVLGGTSGAIRNERMRQLLEQNIAKGGTQRTAPKIMEAAAPATAPASTAVPAVAAAPSAPAVTAPVAEPQPAPAAAGPEAAPQGTPADAVPVASQPGSAVAASQASAPASGPAAAAPVAEGADPARANAMATHTETGPPTAPAAQPGTQPSTPSKQTATQQTPQAKAQPRVLRRARPASLSAPQRAPVSFMGRTHGGW